jgi:4,5-dihydroxyphthalate decarboxylase
MFNFEEFDVSEMSLSSYIMERSRGTNRFIAIPIFPSRLFRHGFIFINSGSGIQYPEDLIGKRVGVPEYQQTASVWIRGFLQHDYGVTPDKVLWINGGLEDPGREEKVELRLPASIRSMRSLMCSARALAKRRNGAARLAALGLAITFSPHACLTLGHRRGGR